MPKCRILFAELKDMGHEMRSVNAVTSFRTCVSISCKLRNLSNCWARLQNCEKRSISFVKLSVHLSVRPSVRMEQLGYHWTDFHEILYLSAFRKFTEKFQVLLKCDVNNGYFTRRPIPIFVIYRPVLLGIRKISDKICTENRNTNHIQ